MSDDNKLADDCFVLPPGVEWTKVEVALQRLRAGMKAVTGVERLPVQSASGRILAEDVTAKRSNPPVANSAVDGFGFAHASLKTAPFSLPQTEGAAKAGHPFTGDIPAGNAIKILTGAPLPTGVDTVILQEGTELVDGFVTFKHAPKISANTRKAGEDVQVNARVFPAGHTIRVQDLALLAATGISEISVRKKLRVGVLSTGDELVQTGQPAEAHHIFDANRPMLIEIIKRWGMAPIDLGLARDDAASLEAALDRGAKEGDVILTTGGASAGEEDHVSAALTRAGTIQTWRIAVKPGRPLVLGHWKNVPIFGLPGNPVAALVCALIFARPALLVMAGAAWSEPVGYKVEAAFSKSKKAGRREYLRARLKPSGQVEVFSSEGSGRIFGLSWATGLVELADGAQEIVPGTMVKYLPFSGFGL